MPELGFHVHRGDGDHLAAAAAAGADFVVAVFSWEDIEPEPGYLYWHEPDAALRAAGYYGLKVVARLDRPPAWAVDESAGEDPFDLAAYAAFAENVARRYGDGLAGLVLWNEPNLALEWNNLAPDAGQYVRMVRTVYPRVKAVAPSLPVFMAGLAFTLGDGSRAQNDLDYLEEFYSLGGGDFIDGMAMHPYGFGRPPEEAPSADRLNFRRSELQREIMVKSGHGEKPVWATEMGWRTRRFMPFTRLLMADFWPVRQMDCGAATIMA